MSERRLSITERSPTLCDVLAIMVFSMILSWVMMRGSNMTTDFEEPSNGRGLRLVTQDGVRVDGASIETKTAVIATPPTGGNRTLAMGLNRFKVGDKVRNRKPVDFGCWKTYPAGTVFVVTALPDWLDPELQVSCGDGNIVHDGIRNWDLAFSRSGVPIIPRPRREETMGEEIERAFGYKLPVPW